MNDDSGSAVLTEDPAGAGGDDREALRRWLLEARRQTGWSGAEMARRAGISPSTINRFLNKDDAPMIGFRSVRKVQRVVAAKLGNVSLLDHLAGASPAGLGEGSASFAPPRSGLVELSGAEVAAVPRYDAAMSAGPGSIIDPQAEPIGHWFIESQWLRAVTRSSPERLAVLKVDGDSMEDTLADGDWVLVDRGETRVQREGIYALQVGDATWVKRLTLNLREKLVRVVSDNPRFPMQELPEDELSVIGRIVWIVARKV